MVVHSRPWQGSRRTTGSQALEREVEELRARAGAARAARRAPPPLRRARNRPSRARHRVAAGRAAAAEGSRSRSRICSAAACSRWVGGAAVVLGVVFFLVMAASRGWIDEPTRVVLAVLGSTALLGGGLYLHERQGRTQAALAAVATAIAALYVTLTRRRSSTT